MSACLCTVRFLRLTSLKWVTYQRVTRYCKESGLRATAAEADNGRIRRGTAHTERDVIGGITKERVIIG
jgi:hypothetical protein